MVVSHGKNWTLLKSSKTSSDNQYRRKLYGRRVGKPLGKTRAEAIEKLLPQFSVPKEILNEGANIDPAALFLKHLKSFRLEIGFGNGEHLTALLRTFPDTGFLGAEPFLNGMACFLKDNAEAQPQNIKVLMDDALFIVNALAPESLEKIYVLNPDPWPKARHHKRRMISQANLDAFARILKPGGEVVMATDVDDLNTWMLEQCEAHPGF